MKTNSFHSAALVSLTLILPAGADVIYSGLKNTVIPTTFTGVTVTIDGGTLNPFFGGVGVANNDLLQPIRESAANLGTLRNFSAGATLDVDSLYLSSGYGGSQDHLGDTFTAGTEGYLGFKLNNTNYGWMRVVFTGNEAGAVIKDWAYDNAGTAIVVGGIQQAAAVAGVQAVSLTLGSVSALADTGGGTISRLEKTGAATATLTGTNTYSGTTTVTGGKLLVNGSITGTGAVSVATGAALGGTGTIAGAVIVDGVLAPGASIGKFTLGGDLTFNSGSTFAVEFNHSLAPAVASDLQVVLGDGSGDSVILAKGANEVVYLSLTDLAGTTGTFAADTTLSLVQYAGAWNNGYFTYGTNELTDGESFTDDSSNHWTIHYGAESGGLNFATEMPGSHFVTLSNFTAIPEPGSLLALGCLLGTGVLLRTRRR